MGAFLSQSGLRRNFGSGDFVINGFSIPFFTAALLSFLSLGAALRWLPESHKPPNMVNPSHRESSKDVLKSLFTRWYVPRWLGPFLALAFLNQFALALFEGTFALHGKEVMQFGPFEMGLVFVVCGFVMAAAQGSVVAWLIARTSERTLLQSGFALMGMGLVMLMTTQNLSLTLFYVAVLAFGVALIVPCLASSVSKRAVNRSGAALGQWLSANNLSQAVGPIVGGFLFVRQIHAPYLLTASLLLATTVYVHRSMLFRSD